MTSPQRRVSTFVRSGLPVVALATVVAALVAPVYAATDSVTITSPAEGATVDAAGEPDNPAVAADPVWVTFTTAGDPVTCSIDGSPAVGCSSPIAFQHLVAGSHTVVVQAGTASDTRDFTVVTALLGDPPVEPRATGKVHARWSVHGRRTTVRRLGLTRLQEGVLVTLRCRGRGCPSLVPFRRVVSDSAHLGWTLRGHVLRPHTKVSITVAKSGFQTKRFVYTVRRGALPRLTRTWIPAN